ncbi:MAG: type II secretion system F family protein [Victivallales bacterium]|nr:type II secretion system F family protein [Victivallales bacterium]
MLYKYKAADAAGKISDVLIEGDNEADSLNRLRCRSLMPLQYYGEVSAQGHIPWPLTRGRKFNANDFTNQLVPLLQAHIPLERALGIIAEGAESAVSREVINALRRGLHEGKKFSELVREHGDRFPRLYANLVETGEETGCLTEVMTELQRFLNAGKELRDFLLTSSIYPAIVLFVTFGVMILVFTVFIPRFARTFADMGRALPLPTQLMFDFSRTITGLWWLWPLLLLGLCYFMSRVRRGGQAREYYDRTVLRLPLFGSLIQSIEISRFIRTLAILIKNHVHLLETIRIATKIVQNRTIAASLQGLSAELRSGAKLSAALRHSAYIPPVVIRMLQVGEESGTVGAMLDKVAEEQEKQHRTRIKRLLAFFEPMVIVFLALTVLVVVISIFLAIMEMNNV